VCGITGLVVKENARPVGVEDEEIFKYLLLKMQARGKAATGVFKADSESGKYILRKKTKSAEEFVDDRQYYNVREKPGNVFIGHTRMPTRGDNVKRNAHPFDEGHVVGAHNGTISNYRSINPKATVDSQVIFEKLAEKPGHPGDAFQHLSGQAMVVWWDKKREVLRIAANYAATSMSPLWLFETNEVIYFCSQREPLKEIAKELGVTGSFIQVEPDEMITISPEDLKKSSRKISWKPKFGGQYSPGYGRNGYGNNGQDASRFAGVDEGKRECENCGEDREAWFESGEHKYCVICKYSDKNATYCNSCGYPVNVCSCVEEGCCENCGENGVAWILRGQRLCGECKQEREREIMRAQTRNSSSYFR